MKQTIISLLTCVVATSCTFNVTAQPLQSTLSNQQVEELKANESRMFINKTAIVVTPTVPVRALKNFANKYAPANRAQWYPTAKGFLAEFSSDSVKHTVWYDKYGRWSGSLICYSEKKLSPDIRHLVKTTYYDYAIVYIWEIATPDLNSKPLYIITLEDATGYKLIRVYEDEMDELKNMVKM